MATALISVYKKSGIGEFGKDLVQCGWNLVASGGTARTLKDFGLPVREISDITGFTEILGGRVKTLHPAIFGAILARSTKDDERDLEKIHAGMIDMVVVDLYPFEEAAGDPSHSLQDVIEMIDIGGAALIRAAAKNYERVTVLTDPGDYPGVIDEIRKNGNTSTETRLSLAARAFQLVARYDLLIASYFSGLFDPVSEQYPGFLSAFPHSDLRYGENPHQGARIYHLSNPGQPLGGFQIQGKALSYNNLLDLDAAWKAVHRFELPSACIVKHQSPCGIASSTDIPAAFELALACDPVSAYGGVIALNGKADINFIRKVGELFVEAMVAPDFSEEALEALKKRKNCRVIRLPDDQISPEYEMRTINHAVLVQALDKGDPTSPDEWKIVTKRKPTSEEMADLIFAWRACQYVRSNAIVLAHSQASVGIGGGQPNRVDSARIAIKNAGEKAGKSALASDGFIPFPDTIEEAARAGITAVIQPGGSIRDAETISMADANQMAMIFTGIRHFRH